MATSSGGSSAVDLIEAADAEHDDAMSKLFFSDSSAAGPVLFWPAVSEIDSTLKSQDSLVALCSKHGVPSEFTPICADRLGWKACTPPPVGSTKMCVYAAALDAGLRFPLHGFYARVLRHYGLAPSQLTPNSWSYLAAFVLLCQVADVEPMVSSFRYLFTICAHRYDRKPTGFHHFQPNHLDASRRLFTGTLPSWAGWKSRFFYLDCPSRWNCPVKWGKPKREHARQVQLTDTVTEKLKQKQKEMQKEMGGIDIKVFLANREMPVGDPPLQSALKVEAGASAAAVGAAAEDAATRKRSRLSPAAVLSAQPGLAPIGASITGGHSRQIPPPGLAPIRASCTGGSSRHIPPPGLAPIRASCTGGSSRHIPSPGLTPIRASSTGGRSGHVPPPQQHSLGDYTSAPRELPGMRARAQAVSIGGSSEVTPPVPHTVSPSDLLQLWETRANASKQAALIVKLNQELDLVKTWNTQWQKELRAAEAKHTAEIAELIAHLRAANDRNKKYVAEREQLIGHLHMASAEVVRLQAASVEIEQVKAAHAAEKDQLKQELEAEANQLKEEFDNDIEQLKHEAYTMGATDMKDLALTMYKGVISPDKLNLDLLVDYNQIQGASPVAGEDQ